MKLAWGILLAAMLFALPARADTLYDVSGTATMIGNDVCNGPCIETMNFSFELDEVPIASLGGYTLDIVPGGTISATGPLLTPTLNGRVGCDRECYIAIYFDQASSGPLYTEFDLGITNERGAGNFSATPFTPIFDTTDYLYTCGGGDQTCITDFCLDRPFGCGAPAVDSGSVSTVVTSPVGTPEPGTWTLLLCGLGLALALRRNRGAMAWTGRQQDPWPGSPPASLFG